ncbi:G patch domain-containing protein 2-like [Haliotis rufescens]|uniref:G patch domain-containing protein 2-like n=1 Tax=Haliotis rufescens TaxID=6454 RepID=UPI00201F2A05|nr:G patch domain-containing protein 2-like [Haliotis rufescens]
MDHSIVKDFQNLRVFSNRNIIRMDELVQDLTNALEESSKGHKSQTENLAPGIFARRMHKKRRGKRRRSDPSPLWKCGTISEASESSIDEALKDYIDTVALLSDSDDISPRRIHRLTVPLTDPTPPVESDSVTENVSPIRPQRRRRKFKSMALDSPSADDLNFVEPIFERHKTMKHKTLQDTNTNMFVQDDAVGEMPGGSKIPDGSVPGKRKRSTKSRSDYVKSPGGGGASQEGDTDGMDITSYSQESSSLSSSESEGLITNDEGREADDEQSDFFLEPGPSCGIAGIIPWWENERVTDSEVLMDKQLGSILTGSFEHMPESSRQSFKTRVSRLMASSGREIRLGRRKLKGKMPSYTMTRFLQDRQKWNQMQGRYFPPRPPGSASTHSGDFKRQRKTPPSSPQDEGYVGENAEPIPDNNIGNLMLQSMGWNPGSGLGPNSDGIQDPIHAYLHPGRKGLGYESNGLSDT